MVHTEISNKQTRHHDALVILKYVGEFQVPVVKVKLQKQKNDKSYPRVCLSKRITTLKNIIDKREVEAFYRKKVGLKSNYWGRTRGLKFHTDQH